MGVSIDGGRAYGEHLPQAVFGFGVRIDRENKQLVLDKDGVQIEIRQQELAFLNQAAQEVWALPAK